VNNCRADARPDISAIVAQVNYVETWTEGAYYDGTNLAAGQTVTVTRTGTTTFARRRISDFFGKPLDYTDQDNWVENNALAKCGPVSYYDFYEVKDDPEMAMLRAGYFVLWRPTCCLCDIRLESVGVIIEDGITTVRSGFGESDGTTTADLTIALPVYTPRRCRMGMRLPWSDDEGVDSATFTVTHEVVGDADNDAEQLVSLDAAGRLDGSLAFDWESPDSIVYRFVMSATDGEFETSTHRAAVPTLDFVDNNPATAADRANFQITLEAGPDGSYGTFRVAFVGRFRRRSVNLIEPQAPGGGYVGLLLADYEPLLDDTINTLPDYAVAPCASGTEWDVDMAAADTGYVRTGNITFTFTIP